VTCLRKGAETEFSLGGADCGEWAGEGQVGGEGVLLKEVGGEFAVGAGAKFDCE